MGRVLQAMDVFGAFARRWRTERRHRSSLRLNRHTHLRPLRLERLEDRRLLSDFYLSFPLPNRTADTVVINSAFDHSMSSEYTADNVVVAYTGERGEWQYGGKYVTTVIPGQRLYAFRNSSGSDFELNGHYEDPNADYLFYDGHPAYDFRTTDQSPDGKVNVLAAASGDVWNIISARGRVRVDHGNGYRTNYYHLDQINVSEGQSVERGEKIGVSGRVDASAPHLHFSVERNVGGSWVPVDPYGWEGPGQDPYTRTTNENLWSPPEGDFTAGDYVRVIAPLNVRADPSVQPDNEISDPDYPDEAPAGSVGIVLEGPESAGGYTWYRIDYGAGSYTGWSSDHRLENAHSSVRITGIDVSHHQGTIGAAGWAQISDSGHTFAFVRSTYSDAGFDTQFTSNMSGGAEAGMYLAPYHFAYPSRNPNLTGPDSAESEANHFLSVAGPYITDGYLRPVLDIEPLGGLPNVGLSDWVRKWLQTVENQTGVEPIVYTNSDYANNYLDASLNAYDLWVAHWTYDLQLSPSNEVWDTWSFWQYSGDEYGPSGIRGATIPGINGVALVDVFNGDLSRLRSEFLIHEDTIPPTVDAFDVDPKSITVESRVTISYKVSDTGGSELKSVELWRTDDTDIFGDPIWHWNDPFHPDDLILARSVGGNGPVSDCFVDSPPSVGLYWYGLHVLDNAGNMSYEPVPPGPIAVTVAPPRPEISVSGNGVPIRTGDMIPSLADGTDFGTVHQGATGPVVTFAVSNDGPATLELGSLQPPNAFAIVDPLPSSISPYTSSWFSLQLDTSAIGSFGGDVTFSTNDDDENPFSFRITATVTPAAPISDFGWQNQSSMPEALESSVVAVLDGRIHVMGGNRGTAHYRYDPSTDTWDALAGVPPPGVRDGGAAVVNSKIYAVGHNSFDSLMRIYDPASDAWSTGTAMPTSRDYPAVVEAGGKVYAIGGWDSGHNPLGTVEVYDPATNTWASGSSMPTPRGAAAGVFLDGLIYVIGGTAGGSVTRSVEAYDPGTNTWTSRAGAPFTRMWAAVTAIEGKVYLIGGSNGFQPQASVEEYDPVSDSWRTLSSGLLTARASVVAGSVNNTPYVVGGWGHTGTLSTIEKGTARYLPTVTVSVQDSTSGEPSDNGVYRITRTGATDSLLLIAFDSGGVAIRGTDYRLKNGAGEITGNTVVIDAGQSFVDVTVEVMDDSISEDVEYATLSITPTTDYVVGSPNGQWIRILDNDLPQVTVSSPAENAAEPSTNGLFRITRTGSTGSSLTVNFDASEGEATRNTDYRLKKGSTEITSNSVVMEAGQSYVDILLEVIDDSTAEATETATLTLASGTGYTLGSPNSASIAIADNDLPNRRPTDMDLSPDNVDENEPIGTRVGAFSTTDPDAGDMFTYAFATGTGDDDNASFTIDGDQLKTAAVFDYEARNSYSIRVRTTDSGGLWYEDTLTINVSDVNETPTDIALSKNTVPENQPAGTLVGTFSTTDQDVGDSHTYSLVTGAGSGDNGSFTISGNQLKTAAAFDHETQDSYSIRVRTTDSGELWYEEAFTINVTPNQAPTIGSLSDSPDPVTQPNNVTLTPNGVSDSDGMVIKVEFYRDGNTNGSLDVGTDQLLGTHSSSSGGWKWTGATGGFPTGTNRYFARAQDDDGAWSNVVTTTGTVNNRAVVVDRRIFYNNSSFTADDAVGPTPDELEGAGKDRKWGKEALRPDETATFQNYTTYSLGLNGIIVEIANLPAATTQFTTADFEFRVGNSDDLATWSDPAETPVPDNIALDTRADRPARVTITWGDNVIQNQWLQVTVKANENTGLAADDVFYFGNTTGEVGNLYGGANPNALVTYSDLIKTRNNIALTTEVTIENGFDFNRDKFVTYSDLILCRNNINLTTGLELITAPISPALPPEPLNSDGAFTFADLVAAFSSLGAFYGDGQYASLPALFMAEQSVAELEAEAPSMNLASALALLQHGQTSPVAASVATGTGSMWRAAAVDAALEQPIEVRPPAYNSSLGELSWMSDYERMLAGNRAGRKDSSAEHVLDKLMAMWP